MKIQKIKVTNFKALKSMEADFKGCSAIILGGNNKGKSSLLSGLKDRLTSGKIDMPVTKGEESGKYEMTLTSGEKLVWEFSAEKESLHITTAGVVERKTKLDRSIIEQLFPKQFDIDTFLHAEPREKVKIIREISGINTDLLDAKIREANDQRLINKRLAEEIRETEADILPVEEVGDVDELKAELQAIEEAQKENFELIQKNQKHRESLEKWRQDKDLVSEKIKQTYLLLEKLEEELQSIRTSIILCEDVTIEEEKPQEYFSEKRQQVLKSLDEANEKSKTEARNEYVKSKLQTKEYYLTEVAKFDQEQKDLKEEKKQLLASAKLPDGMSIDEDMNLYVDGFLISESQISTSKLYISALKLAAMKMGKIKYLHFDASSLDKNSLNEILEWANSQDLQLFIERPDFDGGEIQLQILEA